MNNYFLMRKNEPVCSLIMTDEGHVYKYDHRDIDHDIAPLEYRTDSRWIARWWESRSIPIGQGLADEMLKEKGVIGSSDFLMCNLGLSLDDYYWIRPIDMNLRWEDVNLFDNDFRENLLVKVDSSAGLKSDGTFTSFTPNSSLQGQLEKTWQIRKGKRVLIKGNSDDLSCESFNEVFASLMHKKQGYDNYTDYSLIKIKNRPYAYGCVSECFTNQNVELVTAWALLTSEKKNKNLNDYENLIMIAEKHGMDADELRKDLEYQIMTDYIISNRDRHMNNIGFLRDADSLKLLKMAPIYDSGKSMFVRRYGLAYADIIDCDVNSFFKKESRLLSLVRDKSGVDTAKLPSSADLEKLYQKEPGLSRERIDQLCRCYETKVKSFEMWQNQ